MHFFIQNVNLGICNRPTHRNRPNFRFNTINGRPNGCFCGTIHVPKTTGSLEELLGHDDASVRGVSAAIPACVATGGGNPGGSPGKETAGGAGGFFLPFFPIPCPAAGGVAGCGWSEGKQKGAHNVGTDELRFTKSCDCLLV